jgi:hypothetical protein
MKLFCGAGNPNKDKTIRLLSNMRQHLRTNTGMPKKVHQDLHTKRQINRNETQISNN